MISPIVNYILSQNAGEKKTSLTLDGRCFVYCTLLIHVVGEKLATLEAIAENKPPPRQLVQKNSYNCPYCAVIKIPFKTFLDRDSNLDRNKIGLLLMRHSVSRQLLEYSAAYSSILLIAPIPQRKFLQKFLDLHRDPDHRQSLKLFLLLVIYSTSPKTSAKFVDDFRQTKKNQVIGADNT